MNTINAQLAGEAERLQEPAARTALSRWRQHHPDLFEECSSPADVVLWLRTYGDPVECNRALSALLSLAVQGDQTAGITVVHAVLPLVWASRVWSPPKPVPFDELERARQDLIASLWLVIGEWRGTWRRGIASGLVRRAVSVCTGQASTRGTRLTPPPVPLPHEDLLDLPVEDTYLLDRELPDDLWISDVLPLEELASWANRHGVLTPKAAASLCTLSSDHPSSAALRQRRHRAVKALTPQARYSFPQLCPAS